MVELEALTIINVGKGHYFPGDKFTVAPGRADELIEAKLAKKVGSSDVPKEARADDGAYAEEPATDLATDFTRVKEKANTPIEEAVSAESEKQAHKDNQAIADAEAEKSAKTDPAAAAKQTKEDKSAASEKTK